MAFLNEISQWESGIYRLETSDPVEGGENGKSNVPIKHLTNRTKKIYDVLAANGIYINPVEQSFFGQPIINNASFEGTVISGDLVYYDSGNTRFAKAIADGTNKQNVIGIADVTRSRVVTSGLYQTTFSGSNNAIVYLSDSVAGGIVETATDKAIGQHLYNGIVVLAIAAAASAVAASISPGSITPTMLQQTYYTSGQIDSKCTNWDAAYTDRLNWDGGNTGLNASTARTSLGLTGDVSTHCHDTLYHTKTAINAKCTNWDTAYTDRMKWNGGNTDLDASVARTSLGLTGDVSTHCHATQLNLGTIATQNANNVSLTGGSISMVDSGIIVAGDVGDSQNRVVNIYANTSGAPTASTVKR